MITKQATLPIDAARAAWARIAKGKPDAAGMELFREAQRQMDALQMMEQISAGNMANAKAQAIELERVQSINAELVTTCKAARLAVEDYIMRIQKAGFQPSFGNGVLAQIDAAIASATGAQS